MWDKAEGSEMSLRKGAVTNRRGGGDAAHLLGSSDSGETNTFDDLESGKGKAV